jgi:hypothetical protein
MRRADSDGSLAGFLHPRLAQGDLQIAEVEGWIFRVE